MIFFEVNRFKVIMSNWKFYEYFNFCFFFFNF